MAKEIITQDEVNELILSIQVQFTEDQAISVVNWAKKVRIASATLQLVFDKQLVIAGFQDGEPTFSESAEQVKVDYQSLRDSVRNEMLKDFSK